MQPNKAVPVPRTTESIYAIDFPKSTSNLFLLYTYTNKLSPLSHQNSDKNFPRVSNRLKTTIYSSQSRCACLTATQTLLPQLISSHLNPPRCVSVFGRRNKTSSAPNPPDPNPPVHKYKCKCAFRDNNSPIHVHLATAGHIAPKCISK